MFFFLFLFFPLFSLVRAFFFLCLCQCFWLICAHLIICSGRKKKENADRYTFSQNSTGLLVCVCATTQEHPDMYIYHIKQKKKINLNFYYEFVCLQSSFSSFFSAYRILDGRNPESEQKCSRKIRTVCKCAHVNEPNKRSRIKTQSETQTL